MKRARLIGYLITTIYFVLFSVNLCICLIAPITRPLPWLFTGIILGFALMSLRNNSVDTAQNEYIDFLLTVVKKYHNMIEELIDEVSKPKTKTKTKGAKK